MLSGNDEKNIWIWNYNFVLSFFLKEEDHYPGIENILNIKVVWYIFIVFFKEKNKYLSRAFNLILQSSCLLITSQDEIYARGNLSYICSLKRQSQTKFCFVYFRKLSNISISQVYLRVFFETGRVLIHSNANFLGCKK